MSRKKSPSELEADVRSLDHILLELPAQIKNSGKPVRGTDYAAGFYEGIREIGGQKVVILSGVQKSAYATPETAKYPLSAITSYEVMRRFSPDPKDGIDRILAEVLEEQQKTLGEQNERKKR